jgi:hypothetical protein
VFFKRKNKESHAQKFDKLITWLIVWWAVASMVGLSQTNKWKEVKKVVFSKWKTVWKTGLKIFWKCLIWVLKIFNNK